MRGTIATACRRVGPGAGREVRPELGGVEYEFIVPPNTLAHVALDANAADVLFEGAQPSRRATQRSAGRRLFEFEPGTHRFRNGRR